MGLISPVHSCLNTDFILSLSQDELQLLQRQLEEREVELKRLKDESRLRVESHNRAEGGERGGIYCINCLGAFVLSSSDITSRFMRITQIHISQAKH